MFSKNIIKFLKNVTITFLCKNFEFQVFWKISLQICIQVHSIFSDLENQQSKLINFLGNAGLNSPKISLTYDQGAKLVNH
jgi:hypothetical protein